jgi:site-specific recombinase XerD
VKFQHLGGNLMQAGRGIFYGRLTMHGRRTRRRLKSVTVKDARAELARLQSDHDRSQLGLCEDPLAPALSFAAIADRYAAAGYPGRRRSQDTRGVEAHLVQLKGFYGGRRLGQIDVVSRHEYHAWRLKSIRRGQGHRTVELELSTLNTVLRWAAQTIRGAGVDLSTLVSPRFRTEVRHCTAVMVRSDEELHTLANLMLEDPRSESCGWQLLFEALTGCRTSEILGLRLDAAEGQPGFVGPHELHVHRLKGGCFPWVLLEATPEDAPLRDLLIAHKAWHLDRFKGSTPWYFPGRDPVKPLEPTSLTHALTHAARTLQIGHRTSHGLRAYHVATLRSLGIDDSEISKRLGHRSGVALVEKTYGESRPGWFKSRRQDFLPEATGQNPVPIAWAPWLPAAEAPITVQFKPSTAASL